MDDNSFKNGQRHMTCDEQEPKTPENPHRGHRQRVRALFIKNCRLDGFHEHQILEFLLFYAIPHRDTNALAHRLIAHFGSLNNVLKADYSELIGFGLTENTAALIKLSNEIAKTAERRSLAREPLDSVGAAMDFCHKLLADSKNEQLCVICLDSRSRIINYEIISTGTPKRAPVIIRRIAEIAISNGATAVVLAHNHPSGNCNPSQEDFETTQRVEEMLKTIDIDLYEHIIVSLPCCYAVQKRTVKQMIYPQNVSEFRIRE